MQMLSSSLPCPRCGADAMVTLFGATGGGSAVAEMTFSCPEGHTVPTDVSRSAVLEAFESHRAQPQQAS